MQIDVKGKTIELKDMLSVADMGKFILLQQELFKTRRWEQLQDENGDPILNEKGLPKKELKFDETVQYNAMKVLIGCLLGGTQKVEDLPFDIFLGICQHSYIQDLISKLLKG